MTDPATHPVPIRRRTLPGTLAYLSRDLIEHPGKYEPLALSILLDQLAQQAGETGTEAQRATTLDARIRAALDRLPYLHGIAEGIEGQGHPIVAGTLHRAVETIRKALAGELAPEAYSDEAEPCPYLGGGVCQRDARNHYHRARPIRNPAGSDPIEQVDIVRYDSEQP